MVRPGPTNITHSRSLVSFSTERNQLFTHISDKQTSNLISSMNSDFDDRIKMEPAHVERLLAAVEAKFKRCQTLYFVYFETAQHSILCNDTTTLPLSVDCEIEDATIITRHSFRVENPIAYREMINYNFQTFVITLASLYENLVALSEVFVKKVIVFVKNKPVSTPLRDYIDFHRKLMLLGYRSSDHLSTCLTNSDPFLSKYLTHITMLRNRFMHGYSINIEMSGTEYMIENLNSGTLSARSTDLLIDRYTKEVLEKSEVFIRELMVALYEMGKDSSSNIPA